MLVSLTERAAAYDLIALFDRGRALFTNSFFWSQPGDDFAFAGLGAAHAVEAVGGPRFQQTADDWQSLLAGALIDTPPEAGPAGPLLIGGFAFDTARAATPLWQGYPHSRMVLPRLQFMRAGARSWLTVNFVATERTQPEAETDQLAAWLESLSLNAAGASPPNGHPPRLTSSELRSVAEWKRSVADAAAAIQAGELEKVVLARAVQLRSLRPYDLAGALRHLSANYLGCYTFAIAREDRCFLGATPERLVRLRDGDVLTMSLAGSIKRGRNAVEDERLGQSLLNSAKDRREQVVVTRDVVEALGDVCTRLQVPEAPELLRLGNIQHLCTPITGRLVDGHTVFSLVERLHPTPAVGGRPRAQALALIRDRENLDRGWYAGPVGWADARGEGEFAVALRSALLHGDTATLFAGCGIVADSEPDREYAESILKLKPMLAALSNR